MITIINFSHPIFVGGFNFAQLIDGPYQIVDIPAQFDLRRPLGVQVELLVTRAISAVEPPGHFHAIRLPDQADAAGLIINEFMVRGYARNIRILRVAPDHSTPPRYVAVELIELKQNAGQYDAENQTMFDFLELVGDAFLSDGWQFNQLLKGFGGVKVELKREGETSTYFGRSFLEAYKAAIRGPQQEVDSDAD